MLLHKHRDFKVEPNLACQIDTRIKIELTKLKLYQN